MRVSNESKDVLDKTSKLCWGSCRNPVILEKIDLYVK